MLPAARTSFCLETWLQKILDDGVPQEAAAKHAAHHLLMVYQSLNGSVTFVTKGHGGVQ